MNKTQNVHIILSNRIGDSILALPALCCLGQLIKKSNPSNLNINVLSSNLMTPIFKDFNIFKFTQLNFLSKAVSWINKPDKTLFLQASDKNKGYTGKVTYGKNFIKNRFDINLQYLRGEDKDVEPKLLEFLKNEYNFSNAIIKNFGICLTLGYSVDDIISTFEFNDETLKLKDFYSQKVVKPEKYIVFCLEAANNKEAVRGRRWSDEGYFEIAEYLYQKYEISSVFVGISKTPKIPENPCFFDMRRKLNSLELADTIKNSIGYIGNDTGILHIANLMKKRSISIYEVLITMQIFTPIYAYLNKQLLKPENPDPIKEIIDSDFFF